MKILKHLFISIFISSSLFAQKSELEIIDLGSKELKYLKKYYNNKIDSVKLMDRIYVPYEEMWKGYIGNSSDFMNWVNSKNLDDLTKWQSNKNVNSKILANQLKVYEKEMFLFTGKRPQGKWYIFYGPAWTNLGGLGSGEMLIDLANKNNVSNDSIIFVYPHELNHQIYHNQINQSDDVVLNRILDEGFASYINYIFHQKKNSKAKELYYTEDEFNVCDSNDKVLVDFLSKYYTSKDEKIADNLASRSYKINDNLPGAIAYYLGFRIVEEYVKQNGEDSWKDIYKKKPIDVLLESKILDLYK